MTQVAGNRFWLTVKSLTPGTLSGKWALVMGFVVSTIGSIVLSTPAFTTCFGMFCGMVIGHMACLFKKSERRWLVPGINETCAAVAIQIVIAIWVFNAVLGLSLGHRMPESYGLMFVVIAFGLWLGWGERRIHYLFGFLFLSATIVCAAPNGPTTAYETYLGLSAQGRWLLGILLGLGGCSMLVRFWFLMKSKIDSVTFKRINYFWLASESATDVFDPAPSRPVSVPRRFAARAASILYGKVYLTRYHYFWSIVAIGIALALLIATRGIAEISSGMTCFAAFFFVFVPTMLFAVRVPQSMGRLWLAGVEETRAATAKCLVKITLSRTIPIYLAGTIIVLLQAPISFTWYVSVLVVLLFGIFLAGIVFWIAARSYTIWVGIQTIASTLSLCAGMVVAGLLIPVSTTLVPQLNAVIEGYEIQTLFGAALVNVLFWTACIFDVSKSLGQSKAVMECQPATNPTHSVNAF